jgi:FlaA1/EpsC-like NDP-sugar epimerase
MNPRPSTVLVIGATGSIGRYSPVLRTLGADAF